MCFHKIILVFNHDMMPQKEYSGGKYLPNEDFFLLNTLEYYFVLGPETLHHEFVNFINYQTYVKLRWS